MISRIAGSGAERAASEWFAGLGRATAHGPDIAPGAIAAERGNCRGAVPGRRLRHALATLGPKLPAEALGAAFRRPTAPEGAGFESRNRAFHAMLIEGVPGHGTSSAATNTTCRPCWRSTGCSSSRTAPGPGWAP